MTRRGLSLRTRLLVGMALIAMLLGAVSTMLTLTTRDRLLDQVDERLEMFSVGPAGGNFPDRPDFVEPPPDTEAQPPNPFAERLSDVYQGWIDSGGVLHDRFLPNVGETDIGAPAIDDSDLPSVGRTAFTVDAEGSDATYRVHAVRFDDRVEISAILIDDVQATISRLLLLEIGGAAAILAALGLVSWWVVRLGIRPIKEMTTTASRIAGGDLSVRVPEGTLGTEPAELATALNRMLGRIESALDERAASEGRLRQFVADASHELRTPVTTIRGYAELYRHGGLEQPGTLDDAMRRTEQEAARMGRLVDDMLELARLDQERPLASDPVDLAALARDAGTDARAAAPQRSIEVDAPAAPVVVDGDEDRLRQVIANVVGNALVHTEPAVPIVIRLGVDAGRATLAVEDHGAGMSSEIAERVTERFFRADPARSRHRGGSGLGLSIVEATISAHGGEIEIDSTPGRGTTVTLTLPCASDRGL